jgi:hypothetical protein
MVETTVEFEARQLPRSSGFCRLNEVGEDFEPCFWQLSVVTLGMLLLLGIWEM